MEIDSELQKIIDDYVEQIQEKEEDVLRLTEGIERVTAGTQKRLAEVEAKLDEQFEKEEITEEEYLLRFREEKEKVIQEAKDEFNALIFVSPDV